MAPPSSTPDSSASRRQIDFADKDRIVNSEKKPVYPTTIAILAARKREAAFSSEKRRYTGKFEGIARDDPRNDG
jgi:hypothetical protein